MKSIIENEENEIEDFENECLLENDINNLDECLNIWLNQSSEQKNNNE